MKSMPIRQHIISSVAEIVYEAGNDHPPFFKRSLRLGGKSMKSMLIRQHTISSVAENVYEAGNDHPFFLKGPLGLEESQ